MRTHWRTAALAVCGSALMLSTAACGQTSQAAAALPTQTPAIVKVTEVVTRVVTSVATVVVTATPEPTIPAAKPANTATATVVVAPTSAPQATQAPTSALANGAGPTPQPSVSANTGQVTHGGNMRETSAGAVIGQVCPGDTVGFIQQQEGWVNIRIEQTGADCVADRVKVGTTGWVHGSLVTALAATVPTSTPAPPSPTAEEATVNSTQRIGPIYDSLHEERYSADITLQRVRWSTGGDYRSPKQGKIYVIAYIQVKNLGPSPMRTIGPNSFEVLDSQGAINDNYELISGITDDCSMDIVDLISGGTTSGCVAYEVPNTGKVSLIFAPYQYEGLKPGRYLSFVLRPAS